MPLEINKISVLSLIVVLLFSGIPVIFNEYSVYHGDNIDLSSVVQQAQRVHVTTEKGVATLSDLRRLITLIRVSAGVMTFYNFSDSGKNNTDHIGVIFYPDLPCLLREKLRIFPPFENVVLLIQYEAKPSLLASLPDVPPPRNNRFVLTCS